jgi:pseudouridine kinase
VIGSSLTWYREKGFFRLPQVFLVCYEQDLRSFAGGFQPGLPETYFPVCRKIVAQGLAALVVVFQQQGVVLATNKETVFLPVSPLKGTGNVLSITAGIAGGLAAGYGFRQAIRRAMGKTN